MPVITLRPSDGNASSITDIDCGTPPTGVNKLRGSITLNSFTGLKNFTCIGNGIVSLSGYSNKPTLETLTFYNNSITGSFESFSSCTNLQRVDCWDNDISGELPNLSHLNSLKIFRVYNNNVSGEIKISNLPANLEIFNYGNNNVSGEMPDISSLTKLKKFHCYENNHDGEIPNLSALTNLDTFQCYRNYTLSGRIPDLNTLTALQYFRCYENQLDDVIPDLIDCVELVDFECYRNNLEGRIPDLSKPDENPARQLSKLQNFLCYENNLIGPIPPLDNLSELRKFECQNNQTIDGEIPTLSGVGLVKLERFLCDGNIITGEIPSLAGLTTLNTFQCSANNLSSDIPDLSTCTSLQTFDCSTNTARSGISVAGVYGDIPELHALTALTTFKCNNTEISGYAAADPNIIMPAALKDFQAQDTNLTQDAIDKILRAFDSATPLVSGQKIINLGGTRRIGGTPLVPSYTGGLTVNLAGSSFSKTGITVTVTFSSSHGYIQDQFITVTADGDMTFQNDFRGTFKIKEIVDANTFRYDTVTSTGSQTLAGSGDATIRTTTNPSDGYAYYQSLAWVGRPGGPCNVIINQP
jgi:Leucine-rich repeat (LRR) protein